MTWLRTAGGYEVFFNRDERRSRKPAEPPRVLRAGVTRYVAPLDGDFGGSWIAANEHGLTLAVENGYTDLDDVAHEPASGFESRGLLLISLVDARDSDEALRRIEAQDLHRFRSFLLTIFDARGTATLASWLSGTRNVETSPSMPLVSSSFETLDVRRSRQELFRRMVERPAGAARAELHRAYHESHLPERGPRSVCMHRPEAETVSFSHVEVDAREVRFHYAPHSPCRGRPRGAAVTLPRGGAAYQW
jgi:hypothetical protein